MRAGQEEDGRLPARRTPFRLDRWQVEPDRNRIVDGTGETLLEPKVMDVLAVLAARPGAVLPREDIIDAVWGHSFGADESLTRAVSLLRKTLAPSDTPMIETIARRGYRLAASVEAADLEPTPAHAQSRRRTTWILFALAAAALLIVAGIGLRTIFRTPAEIDGLSVMVQASAGDAIATNVAASLGDALARAPLLRVHDHAGGSIAAYRIALAPATTANPGTVRLQLFAGDDDTLLWSATVAGDGTGRPDPASIHAVAGQLIGRILIAAKRTLRTRPVADLRPWQLVLLATWIPGDDEVFLAPHKPDAFFLQRRALELDPRYAPAHAALASGLAYHAMFDPAADTPQDRQEAARHAAQAQALAPYDAGVLSELATYRRLIGDRDGTLALLKRVAALQPDHPLAPSDAVFIDALCRPPTGSATTRLRTILDRTAPDDPIRWVLLSHLADLALGSGEWTEAARDAAASRQIVHQTWSGITLSAALAMLGRSAEARDVARETRLEWPRLDGRSFARRMAGTWCMGGNAGAAGDAFARITAGENGENRPSITPPSGPPQDSHR